MLIIIQSQLLTMIYSIPTLLKERSKEKTDYLLSLAYIIPCQPIYKIIQSKVLERLFMMDFRRRISVCQMRYLNKMNQKQLQKIINKGSSVLSEIDDPVEHFFIRAILQSNTWKDLIIENQWDNILFEVERQKWTLFEEWILFLCLKTSSRKKAIFLFSSLTKRSVKNLKASSTHCSFNGFQKKLKKLMEKNICQLELIHYQIERNLLISLRLNENFNEIVARLHLQQTLKSNADSLQLERGSWIKFLCCKFQDNSRRESFKIKIVERKPKIQWVQYKYLTNCCSMEEKCSFIMRQYLNFQDSFTGELEVTLLDNLRKKRKWAETKINIQQIFKISMKNNCFNNTQVKSFIRKIKFIDINQQIPKNPVLGLLNCNEKSKKENSISDQQFKVIPAGNLGKVSQISFLQIIMFERNKQEIKKIVTLAMEIQCQSYNNVFIQRVLEKFLMIQTTELRYLKTNSLKFIQERKLKNLKFTPQKIIDPLESLLTKAIVQGQNWNDLIFRYKWNKHFYQIGQWSYYEDWILFLCSQKFKSKKQAKCLYMGIIQRSSSSVLPQQYRLNSNHHFLKKLQKLLDKDIDQLSLIHYEMERNLLVSIKLRENFNQTARRLELQQKLKSETDLFQNERQNWIQFLCSKLSNQNIMHWPSFNRHKQKIIWRIFQISSISQKNNEYDQKLKYICKKYKQDFHKYFTNQIEFILLQEICHQNSWEKVKERIQNICTNNHIDVSTDSQTESIIDQLSQFNESQQKYQPNYQQNYSNPSISNKTLFQVKNNGEFSNKERNKIFTCNKRINLKQESDNSNIFIPKQKFENQHKADYQSEKQIFQKGHPQKLSKQSEINGKQITIKKNYPQPINKKDIYSVLQRGKQSLRQLHDKYFETHSQLDVLSYYINNKYMIEPIYQDIMSLYQKNLYLTNQISNSEIKTLMEIVLIANVKEQRIGCNYDELPCQFNKKDISKCFVQAFDQLVNKVQSRELKGQIKYDK